jgi:hypothetical protein
MKWFHGIAAALFALSAVLQWNDPDPVAWMLLYAAAAILAGLAMAGRAPLAGLAVLAGVCAVWMALLSGSMADFLARGDWSLLVATMKAGEPLIEESREFLGLGLVLLWSLLALLPAGRVRPAGPAQIR